ncbi:MAG: 30S ribosomal protein S2 [Candidatus Micrarchaeota archaeon]
MKLEMELYVPQETYLSAGVHIGTRLKNGSMRQYIYRAREDGLHVIDLKKLDERLHMAVNMISRYDPKEIAIIGSKDNAKRAIELFCEVTGCVPMAGRFAPGRLTNPSRKDFAEPSLVLVVDPGIDKQAVREAFTANMPVIAFCDTNNGTKYIDLVMPTNNKGRKAIALLFWVMAREVLRAKGALASDEDYTYKPEDFEA